MLRMSNPVRRYPISQPLNLAKAFLLTWLLVCQYPALAAVTFDVECWSFNPAFFKLYKYVDPRHHPGFETTYQSICGLVKEGTWSREVAYDHIYPYIFRLAACRQRRINPDYQEFLENQSAIPDSVILAHNRFCDVTFDPEYKWQGEKNAILDDRLDWLRREGFCLSVREIAYPSGFFEKLFEPDVPTVKNYRSVTDEICRQLRNGDIDFSEAVYRWEQANLEFDKHFSADVAKKMARDLKEPIESLFKMLGKVK